MVAGTEVAEVAEVAAAEVLVEDQGDVGTNPLHVLSVVQRPRKELRRGKHR